MPNFNYLTIEFVPCIEEHEEEKCADVDTAFAHLSRLGQIFVEVTFDQLKMHD